MARTSNQKQKLTVLKDIFSELSGPSRPITMKEIIAELAAKGISAERKSIYNDIETLRLLGMDIQTVRTKTTGYYLASREFELSELKLLVDAVRASKFIPEKQSAKLMNKLTLLAPAYERPSLNRSVFVSDRARSIDSDIFNTVDRIHEAIEKDRNITFNYFQWTAEKKKELRRGGGLYHISPWSLVWDDSNYYLIGYDNDKNEIRHFRVDKMLKTAVNDIGRSGKEEFKKYGLASYSNAVFGMFGGKPERVTLRCAKRLANVMLDRFGRDTAILNDGDFFRIHVNVIPSPVFLGWVLSFGSEVTIVSPEHIKDKLKELYSDNSD